LLERNDIVVQRATYLKRMKKNDAMGSDKKLVVYLDKTWIHLIYTVSKCQKTVRQMVLYRMIVLVSGG
jgi:hypothetical protein